MQPSRLSPIPLILSLVALFPACASLLSTPEPGELLNRHISRPYDASALIDVLFATNRRPNPAASPACSNHYFSTNGTAQVSYGTCSINVPKKHAVGSVDRTDARYADPNDYFKLGAHDELPGPTFFQRLATSQDKEILLFVHGFNVRYEEAVLRTAQLTYDAKFPGTPVVFTWPAGASDGLVNQLLMNRTYAINKAAAARTVEPFAEFLEQLAGTGKTVHVYVHSMGHQIVLPAVAKLAAPGKQKFLGELILNAPDFPTDEFRKLAPNLSRSARRVTLYCSPGDNALVSSQQFNGNHRVGQCAKTPGIDVINVNEIDSVGLGHGYYSGRAVLTDVYQVLLGVDVQRRLFIRVSDPGGGEDYILRR